ncbi:MAG: hypothetical protein ACYTEL_26485 [Planctomycetota bacterium]|jgi:TatD family-associated radical SAM protein
MTETIPQGKIVYRFTSPAHPANILYVNLIGRYSCPNDCLFCGRPRLGREEWHPNVYEQKAGTSLYLPESPPLYEVLDAIGEEIRPDDEELAIVGLGEPLIYLQKVCEVVKSVGERYPYHDIRTRVDTDGVAACRHDNAVWRLNNAGLDEIRIALNAVNNEDYIQLCRPKLEAKDPFSFLVGFVQECLGTHIRTKVSFVIDFESKDDGVKTRPKDEYATFAASLGIPLEDVIWRDYVPPPPPTE